MQQDQGEGGQEVAWYRPSVTSTPAIWVATSFFEVEPGEDGETNPGVYGRAFARWVADRLRAHGESIEQVLAEDWGRCIVVTREPYRLWIGCHNRVDRLNEWGAFVTAEPGLMQRLFGTVDPGPAVARLHRMLEEIMHEVPRVERVWTEDGPRR
jgi:hypothetical protein